MAAAAPGSITGTVREAASEEDLSGVEVCAYSIEEEEGEEGETLVCELTGFDGTYALANLAPGKYEVEFWARELGYATQFYDHRPFYWEADPVEVESGATTIGIDADLEEEAAVAGAVRSASTGEGLEEVEVCAWEVALEAGRCTLSEPSGEYGIGGLIAGTYKVEFFPYEPFEIQFWDHASSWEAADALSLEAGELASGINGDLLGGPPPPVPPVVTPPPAPPVAVPAAPRRKHCKKGFRKKRVKGKVRCVKVKKHRRRHAGAKRPARLATR
ncbi:MAG TPA: carboxypeptidase-like regulatory domain-containing protein [Solirubrobacterales bacterium]|nr:carboxypeptidase-like regulatory domain-containing protein [Solirubrobacterales bacterium]